MRPSHIQSADISSSSPARAPQTGTATREFRLFNTLTRQTEAFAPADGETEVKVSRHITGQDLCHALRHLAHDRYGYLALPVLQSWGLKCTGDIGEVVYNLIKIGEMSKSPDDSREHFDDVFDFEQALLHDFAISPAKEMVK